MLRLLIICTLTLTLDGFVLMKKFPDAIKHHPHRSEILETFADSEQVFYFGSGFGEQQIIDVLYNYKEVDKLEDLLGTNWQDVSDDSGSGEAFPDHEQSGSGDDRFNDISGSGTGEILSDDDNENMDDIHDYVTTSKSPTNNDIAIAGNGSRTDAKGREQSTAPSATQSILFSNGESIDYEFEFSGSEAETTTGTNQAEITRLDDVIDKINDPDGSGSEPDLSTVEPITGTDQPEVTSVTDDVIIISDETDGSGSEPDLSTNEPADQPEVTSGTDDVIIISDDPDGSGSESDLSTIASTATGTDQSMTKIISSKDLDSSTSSQVIDEYGVSETTPPKPNTETTKTILYKVLTSKEGINLHQEHSSVDDEHYLIPENDLASVQTSHIVTDTLQKEKTTTKGDKQTTKELLQTSINPLSSQKQMKQKSKEVINKDTLMPYFPLALIAFGLAVIIIPVVVIAILLYRRKSPFHFKTLKETADVNV